jgi:lipopolysaccharide biosynthesis glycosyltransferase
MTPLQVFIGYDPRQPVAYNVLQHSIVRQSSKPVSITPLILSQLPIKRRGLTEFTYSRFLVPYLCNFAGKALFMDADMVVNGDIAELWALRDDRYAVMVAKHDYTTKHPVKYLGAKNEDYPRKNWSSLVLWNCRHIANRILKPEFVSKSTGAQLHRFSWLHDEEIGSLPLEWNWLVSEYDDKDASLYHYTVGTPCFPDYKDCQKSDLWHRHREMVNAVQT